MSKSLSEMSLEELWQLFPIILKEHNPEYRNWYLEAKEKLEAILPEDYIERINQIRYLGDWDELYFRDYLIAHPEVAAEYGKLKMSLEKEYKHNRDSYTEAKTKFIQKWTAEARKEFGQKYSSNKV